MAHPAHAYIALGSNLADRLAYLRGGLAALARLPATCVEAWSSVYRSVPASNLADRLAYLRGGLAALARLPATCVEAWSSVYRSVPVGLRAQPDYLNAVCHIRTQLPARLLLRQLLAIEAAHGRLRLGIPTGGPRTLDLDLLLYGHMRVRTHELELPHPRMHQRAFVLEPLCEIDPDLTIPDLGRAARWLLECGDQETERIATRDWPLLSQSQGVPDP